MKGYARLVALTGRKRQSMVARKSGPVRLLIVFVAAMFLANSVAYGARVCIAELAGLQHEAVSPPAAAEIEHQCPSADDAGLCLAHCTQGFKSDQRASLEIPGLVVAPVLFLPYASFEARPTIPQVAFAPRLLGPPLTILFRNLRN